METLQQLQHVFVTQEVLAATGAGKVVKALTKAQPAEVAEHAKAVVKAWKQCILSS